MLSKLQMKALETLCYVLGAGAFGVFIRWLQNTAGTTEDMLYNRNIWTYLVPLVIIIGFFLFRHMTSSIKKERYYLNEDLSVSLANNGKLFSVIRVIIGLVMATGGALLFAESEVDMDSTLLRIVSLLAVLTGGAFIWMMNSYNKSERSGFLMCIASLLPIVLFCFWIVCTYKMNDINGVVWQYGVEIISVCAAIMAFFRCAGFSYASADLFKTLSSSMFGIFMLVIALADERYTGQQMILIAAICMLLYYDWVLISNLEQREAPPSYQPSGGFEQLYNK